MNEENGIETLIALKFFISQQCFNLMSQQSTDRSIDQVGGGRIVKEMISEIEVNRQISLKSAKPHLAFILTITYYI